MLCIYHANATNSKCTAITLEMATWCNVTCPITAHTNVACTPVPWPIHGIINYHSFSQHNACFVHNTSHMRSHAHTIALIAQFSTTQYNHSTVIVQLLHICNHTFYILIHCPLHISIYCNISCTNTQVCQDNANQKKEKTNTAHLIRLPSCVISFANQIN